MHYTIDAAAGRTLMKKTKDEAYNLIEEMPLNNYQWFNECDQPEGIAGELEVVALALLTTKLDVMTQRLD